MCMAWGVEVTDEFKEWYYGLTDAERVPITANVDLLEVHGPALGRPHADTVKGSAYPNMKELRVQYAGKPYRILFAFDPRQSAILLIGGIKGKAKWYEKTIALADRLYAKYLGQLKKEGLI